MHVSENALYNKGDSEQCPKKERTDQSKIGLPSWCKKCMHPDTVMWRYVVVIMIQSPYVADTLVASPSFAGRGGAFSATTSPLPCDTPPSVSPSTRSGRRPDS